MQSVATVSMCCLFLLTEQPLQKIKHAFAYLVGISFIGIFLVYLISVFNSSDYTAYFNVVKNKIPLVFVWLTFLSIEKIEKKHVKLLLYVFIACGLISSFWSYLQYMQDPKMYIELYALGQVMPTLIHHISFSVLLCFIVLFILNNLLTATTKTERIINLFLLIWFIYFIHILSVRTGIVLLYISLFLFALSILINYKSIVFASVLIVIVLISFNFSYQKIPTIKNKIDYTIYGLKQLKNNTDSTNQTSDARRILSDKIGIELIKQNPYFGVGFGDIKNEMNQIYKAQFPTFTEDVYSHIHNQYLYVMASVGLFFGSVFCLLLLLPLIYFIKENNIVFSIAYLLLLLVMFWESFIENQLGTSIFLVICSIGFVNKKDA